MIVCLFAFCNSSSIAEFLIDWDMKITITKKRYVEYYKIQIAIMVITEIGINKVKNLCSCLVVNEIMAANLV